MNFRIATLASVLFMAGAMAGSAVAANQAAVDEGVNATLDRFYAQSPEHRELVRKAAAVLVFPRITKAGVGVAGERGQGALLVDGSIVGHYQVTGASLGATVGAARSSEVILFMTREARDRFEASKGWTIGADADVAIAKAGAGADATSETMRHAVVAFVFDEHGLIADVSLQGTKITRLPG
jgi:lipid-binding SYLF domain-containing protein